MKIQVSGYECALSAGVQPIEWYLKGLTDPHSLYRPIAKMFSWLSPEVILTYNGCC